MAHRTKQCCAGAQADAHASAIGLMLRRHQTDTPNLDERCLVSTAATGP